MVRAELHNDPSGNKLTARFSAKYLKTENSIRNKKKEANNKKLNGTYWKTEFMKCSLTDHKEKYKLK